MKTRSSFDAQQQTVVATPIRPLAGAREAALWLALCCSGLGTFTAARADVIVDPNQIEGVIEWNNPAGPVLTYLSTVGFNTVLDNPTVPSTITAREILSGPRQASQSFFPAAHVSTPYTITVSAEDTPGIQYDVVPGMILVNGQVYYFAKATSEGVVKEPEPNVILDHIECAGLIRVHYRNATGGLVPVDSSSVYAYIPANANELQAYGGPVQGSGATDYTLVVRGGNTFDLRVSANTHLGSSHFLDYITFHTASNYTVTVPCDGIVDVTLIIPDVTGGGPTNGTLGQIIGRVDMVTEREHLIGASFTVMTAFNGPQNNFRLSDVGLQVQPAQNGPCPGTSPFVGLPSCNSAGRFVIGNLLPSDYMPDLNSPSGPRPYSVYGTLAYGVGRRFQRFQTPGLHGNAHNPRVTVPSGGTVDLGDTFVFHPGWVVGDVYLCAPDEPGQSNSPLRYLHRSSDDDNNLDGIPDDFTFNYSAQIAATGRDELGSGATRSAGGGDARALFEGGFVDSGPDKDHFVGDYRLTLGGLNGQTTRWNQRQLWLNFVNLGAGEHHSSQIQIHNQAFENVEIVPGQTVTNNHRYGMSKVTVRFHTTSGLLSRPRIIGPGSFNGTDFEGNPANYTVNIHYADGTPGWLDSPQPDGSIVMCLAEGFYTFEPTVFLVDGGSSTYNSLTSFTQYVGACSILDITPCLRIELTNVFDCPTNRTYRIAGSVASCTNVVTNISYVLNGVTTRHCDNCGVNPGFAFDIVLADCENTLSVIARDINGDVASLSRSLHFDVTPPVLTGCTNLSTNSLAGTNGNYVSFAVSALDNCDGPLPVSCEPPSGSFFENGTTPVICSAVDRCGNSNTCQFTVEVGSGDCLGLNNVTLTCLSNSPGSFRYSFTAQNLTPGPVKYLFVVPEPDCFTTSPSYFTFDPPLQPGESRPNLSMTLENIQSFCGDSLCLILSLHNSNFVFCCAVTNCIPNPKLPRVDCPSNIAVHCTSPAGALVNYPPPTAGSLCCAPVFVTCVPAPGLFAPGETTVNCTAVDACFNTNVCQFTVTVLCPTNCCENCTTNDYVSVTNAVPAGYSYLANPLCHGSNNNLLALLTVPDGSVILIWNEGTQAFDTYTYDTIFGGWVDGSFNLVDAVNLDPGEGFALFNPGAAYSIVWTGCVPLCPPPCLPGTNCVLVGGYGTSPARWTNLSSCPPVCGTQVRIWNGGAFDVFTYYNGWTPSEPVLPAGHSAWVCLTNCPCPCLLSNTPAPPNDQCVNAMALAPGASYGSTLNATPSPAGSFPPCGGSLASPDVWYTFTAPCPGGMVCVDTCLDPCNDALPPGSSPRFDTVLSAYTGTCALLTQVACNNNSSLCGTNAPQSSRVCFPAKPLVPYLIRVSGRQGASGCFALNVTFQPDPPTPPKNDDCTNAIPILCNQNKPFNTCNATTGGPNDCPIARDVWFKYAPLCTGAVSIATCGSFFDTALAVYTGSCNNLNLVACNNDALDGPCAGGVQSRATFIVTAPGTTYYIRVGGANGAAGFGNLSVIGPNPDVGTCPPTNHCSDIPQKRLYRISGTSIHTPWSWCLSSPCCFNLSGTVANPPPAGAPASALVAAMVASINAVCPTNVIARQLPYHPRSNPATNLFWIAVYDCDNCCLPGNPKRLPFVFRVGAVGVPCEDMCVVVPSTRAIPVPTTGPCAFNPFIGEEPLSETDCNNNGEDDVIDIVSGTSLDNDENGVPDECPITLSIAYEFVGDETVISWAASDAILEFSSTITGPWTALPDATSPYVLPAATGQRWFRLRTP